MDCVIVGGGVAGLSAGIFAARRGLATLIIGLDQGGQTASTAEIENYPGCGRIEGPDLICRFFQEAELFGCHFVRDEIQSIERGQECYMLGGHTGTYSAHTVILATGKKPRRLNVPGEDVYIGHGLVYAGALDASLFKGHRVVVVGGGNSALDIASRASIGASHVSIVCRRESFSGEQLLLDRVAQAKNVDYFFSQHVIEILGENQVNAVRIRNEQGEEKTLAADVIVVAIGFEARNEWYAHFVDCTDDKRVIIDAACKTTREGIFAAGDCTTIPYQQIVISAGEGAKAALSAYYYIQEKTGKRAVSTDWGYVR